MKDWYSELENFDGRKCFTLTQNKPAIMHIDDFGVTVEYPSGGTIKLAKHLLDKAFTKLRSQRYFNVYEDIHNDITHRNGAQTDRLMAVLREIPGNGLLESLEPYS